jgi:hypothetical protein
VTDHNAMPFAALEHEGVGGSAIVKHLDESNIVEAHDTPSRLLVGHV